MTSLLAANVVRDFMVLVSAHHLKEGISGLAARSSLQPKGYDEIYPHSRSDYANAPTVLHLNLDLPLSPVYP